MNSPKDIFHKISYLQYPLILVSVFYYARFIATFGESINWQECNSALVFYGLSISMSTLQDTTKTQNKLSRKIWEHPRNGKIALFFIAMLVMLFLVYGLIGFINSRESVHKEISFGVIVIGIGLTGVLKSAIEMFENHRTDKHR